MKPILKECLFRVLLLWLTLLDIARKLGLRVESIAGFNLVQATVVVVQLPTQET